MSKYVWNGILTIRKIDENIELDFVIPFDPLVLPRRWHDRQQYHHLLTWFSPFPSNSMCLNHNWGWGERNKRIGSRSADRPGPTILFSIPPLLGVVKHVQIISWHASSIATQLAAASKRHLSPLIYTRHSTTRSPKTFHQHIFINPPLTSSLFVNTTPARRSRQAVCRKDLSLVWRAGQSWDASGGLWTRSGSCSTLGSTDGSPRVF